MNPALADEAPIPHTTAMAAISDLIQLFEQTIDFPFPR